MSTRQTIFFLRFLFLFFLLHTILTGRHLLSNAVEEFVEALAFKKFVEEGKLLRFSEIAEVANHEVKTDSCILVEMNIVCLLLSS